MQHGKPRKLSTKNPKIKPAHVHQFNDLEDSIEAPKSDASLDTELCQGTVAEKLMQNLVIIQRVRDASDQIKVQTTLCAEVDNMDLCAYLKFPLWWLVLWQVLQPWQCFETGNCGLLSPYRPAYNKQLLSAAILCATQENLRKINT